MREIDYAYISKSMANLSCFPIQYYRESQLVDFYSLIPFPCNPAQPYLDQLLNTQQSVAYYISPLQMYFGIVRQEKHQILIGPVCYVRPDLNTVQKYAELLNLKYESVAALRSAINSIPVMGVHHFLHMLSLIYYYITDEKVNLNEVMFSGALTATPLPALNVPIDPPEFPVLHTTSMFENQMIQFVEEGNLEKLLNLLQNSSPGQIGRTSRNQLRQTKNTFIVTATLVSRAAIRGGMDLEEAMTLSDQYIQRSEPLNSMEQVLALNFEMVTNYTERVAEIISSGPKSKFVRSISSYIKTHISEPIRVEQICEDFFMSRSWLTARFKEETGKTITDYITEIKIGEAKKMLAATNHPVVEISSALGFSSQSHFQNTFKRIVGVTPKQYRNMH